MKKKVLLICLCLTTWGMLSAQEMSSDTMGLLNDVMKRIEAKSRFIPTISGTIQGGYFYKGYYNNVLLENENTFFINTARLNIKGAPCNWFDYNFQVEFANTVKILDFQLNFHPFANANVKSQYLNIWLGQGKTPFSLDNSYGPANYEAVAYTQATQALCGPTFTNFSGGRDIGVALYGYAWNVDWGGAKHDFFDYKLGLYNGSGMNSLNVDKYMDIAGHLYLHPVKALTVGASFYTGWYEEDKTNAVGKVIGTYKANRYRAAASVRYADGAHWNARAEYLWGLTDQLNTDGWYASVEYVINPNKENKHLISIVGRYDGLRSDMDYSLTSHNTLIGVNYRPMKWLYFQAHYNCRFTSSRIYHTVTTYNMPQVMACLIF